MGLNQTMLNGLVEVADQLPNCDDEKVKELTEHLYRAGRSLMFQLCTSKDVEELAQAANSFSGMAGQLRSIESQLERITDSTHNYLGTIDRMNLWSNNLRRKISALT